MASHNHKAVTSSENPNWRTPGWLATAIDAEFGIVLDCAADKSCAVGQNTNWFLGPDSPILENALSGIPWWDIVIMQALIREDLMPYRALFCNPPYSDKLGMPIEPWIKAMAEQGQIGTVVGVVPYSPQTQWWTTFVEGDEFCATEIRRFRWRMKFEPPPNYVPPMKEKKDGTRVPGKASGANVNTAVVIWKPMAAFRGRWSPLVRYWEPAGCPHAVRAAKRLEAGR